jgi:hypothetical protein
VIVKRHQPRRIVGADGPHAQARGITERDLPIEARERGGVPHGA